VLVKIHVASINPIDDKVAKGYLAGAGWDTPFPFTAGYDFAGVVEAVGPVEAGAGVEAQAEAEALAPGDRVFAVNWGAFNHNVTGHAIGGAFAEYMAIAATSVSRVPEGVALEQAAAVALVGTTAAQSLDAVGVAAGSRVLILGGSSAVGAIAIQLAKSRGAHVITTASTRTLDYVAQFGADSIIDYTAGKWEEDPLVGGVDVVFATVGETEGFSKAKKEGVLKADGAFISIASFDAGLDPSAHPPLRFASFFCLSNNKGVQDALAGAIAAGQLVVPIEEEFPFTSEGVSSLFAKQEAGKSKGKNILRIV
jgi:hypothetical protein